MTGETPQIEGRRLHGNAQLEPASWRLPEQAVSDLFYTAWSNSTRVAGAFGWFSSGWIAIFAHGIAAFLADDRAQIDMTIAPVLFPPEHDELTDVLIGGAATEEDALQRVVALLYEGTQSKSALTQYAVKALAWMVVNKSLTIRVAVPVVGSNYHPKVWVFDDGQDKVAIRGSANATGRALSRAIEHLDVDPSWRDRYRVEGLADMVAAWAAGDDDMLERTYVLDADVLAEHVQRFAPPSPPTVEEYEKAHAKDTVIDEEPTESDIPGDASLRIPEWLEWTTGMYAHQERAVRAWEDQARRKEHLLGEGRERQGILSIVTGGGKTKAALIATTRLHQELDEPLMVVIAAPGKELVRQWAEEIDAFSEGRVNVLLPSLEGNLKKRKAMLAEHLLDHGVASGRYLTVMVVTFNMLKAADFQQHIKNAVDLSGGHSLLIGDEAHGLGAEGFMSSPPDFFSYRLGLSATPERWDEDETARLDAYFGGRVFEFSLAEAQAAGALVEYDYHPVAVAELSDDEVAEYREASERVGKAYGDDEYLSAVLAQRRGILETAERKYDILADLLARLIDQGDGSLRDLLLYCSSKDSDQMKKVCEHLEQHAGIIYRKITEHTKPRDRQVALRDFAAGRVHVLVAKKILDEGVDIPSVRTAILMASSTSQREWVQRRGRVLRRDPSDPDKRATIYDIPALTTAAGLTDNAHETIVRTECERLDAFNNEASNSSANNDFIASARAKYLGIE